MPDQPEADKAALTDELLLLAESLGEAIDRLNRIESEYRAQAVPITAARATQDTALRALEATLAGINAVNFGAIEQSVSALTARLNANEKELASLRQLIATHAP